MAACMASKPLDTGYSGSPPSHAGCRFFGCALHISAPSAENDASRRGIQKKMVPRTATDGAPLKTQPANSQMCLTDRAQQPCSPGLQIADATVTGLRTGNNRSYSCEAAHRTLRVSIPQRCVSGQAPHGGTLPCGTAD